MIEILEIAVSVLAVFGAYTILDKLRFNLLFSKKVRMSVRVAIIFQNEEQARICADYARALWREQKICDRRLIILTKDDIINVEKSASSIGDVYEYKECKEKVQDAQRSDTRE